MEGIAAAMQKKTLRRGASTMVLVITLVVVAILLGLATTVLTFS